MTVESVAKPQQLQSVQALRGAAALLVVLFHAAAIWRELSGASGFYGPWDQGWAGVDLFFVISGFVMVWVAGEREKGLLTSVRFLLDRATRIFPLWWVFCTLMALYFWLTYGQLAAPDRLFTGSAWQAYGLSMALWPFGEQPVLAVGWTLTYEFAFYGLFAILLLIPVRFRSWGLAAWGVGLLALLLQQPDAGAYPDSWLDVLTDPLCFEFLLGAMVAYGVRAIRWFDKIGMILAGIGTILFIAMMAWSGEVGQMHAGAQRALQFGVPASILLLGLVLWERGEERTIPKGLTVLGDASYTLYLSHFITLLALKRLCAALGLFDEAKAVSMIGFMIAGTLISLILSMILYRLIEKPLLRLSRAPSRRRRASAP